MTLFELCCGTAAVSQHAAGAGHLRPLASYQGGKHRFAAAIVSTLGIPRPDRIVICDAGPWGKLWSVLHSGAWAAVAKAILRKDPVTARLAGVDIFAQLANNPPPDDPVEWAATFLMLQSASARGRPITPRQDGWDHHGYAHLSPSAVARGFRERLRPDLLSKRVLALGRVNWPKVDVIHGDVHQVTTKGGTVVYIDPPYEGTTPYAHSLDRADVISLAREWDAAGARVGISEAEGLEIPSWHHTALTQTASARIPANFSVHTTEWLTTNEPPRGQQSLDL